jgi:propionyl-CoA synthetase
MPSQALDDSKVPFYRCYPDGSLNSCFNALDRHVAAGHGRRRAATYSYAELIHEVAPFAGVLTGEGVGTGDRVVIYLPRIHERRSSPCWPAPPRIGAVRSVVFGGFAPHELAARIDDCRPKVVVSAPCGIEKSRLIAYTDGRRRSSLPVHAAPP